MAGAANDPSTYHRLQRASNAETNIKRLVGRQCTNAKSNSVALPNPQHALGGPRQASLKSSQNSKRWDLSFKGSTLPKLITKLKSGTDSAGVRTGGSTAGCTPPWCVTTSYQEWHKTCTELAAFNPAWCYICEVAGCLLVNLSKRSTPRVCGLRRWGLSSTAQLISKLAKFICMCFNRTQLLAVFLVLSLVRITTSTSCPTNTCPTPVFFPTTTPPAPS